MTKILLINPPTMGSCHIGNDNYFPLGLLYLGTTAKHSGIDVEIVDVHNAYYGRDVGDVALREYAKGYLNKRIEQYKPDVIGIGAIFSGAFKGLKIIAKEIKCKFPNIPIVAGGIHATMFAREILEKYNYIDYVVIGEGEYSFFDLIYGIMHDGFSGINGVTFRHNGGVVVNPKTQFIQYLNALPLVDYSLINVDDYEMDTSNWYSPKGIEVGRPFPIISSRSCSQRCNFCNMKLVHGPTIRFRSPKNVLDEMEGLYHDYNARYFQLVDDNLTFDKERILAICEGINKRGLDIQFDIPNGVSVNRLDRDIIDALVKAGLIKISLAIESGSEYIRNRVIGKGLTTVKIYEVVNMCAEYKDLWRKGFFIIGMPQETKETLEETAKIINELPLDNIGVFFATPYPGTELFRYCQEHNLISGRVEDYMEIEDLQLWSDKPHFKPFEVTEEDLIGFRQRYEKRQ